MFKAFGFDLDDTLYNRNDVYRNVFKVMQNNVLSVEVDFKEFNIIYQQLSNKYYNLFMDGHESKKEYQQQRIKKTYLYFGKNITEDEVIIFQALHSYFKVNIELRPYMGNILNYLKKIDMKLFVLTNGESSSQWQKINALGLSKYVPRELIFISDDLNASKPDQDIYKKVEEKIDISSNEIIYLGDNLIDDIQGSSEAGWYSIYFNIRDQQTIKNSNLLKVVDDEESLYHFIKYKF